MQPGAPHVPLFSHRHLTAAHLSLLFQTGVKKEEKLLLFYPQRKLAIALFIGWLSSIEVIRFGFSFICEIFVPIEDLTTKPCRAKSSIFNRLNYHSK